MMVAGLLIGLSASATAKPWMQLGQDLHGDEIGDLFGCSVSLSSNGTTALIGGPHNDKNGDNSGHARVYDWDGTLWVQRGADIHGLRAGDMFGRHTALSADGNTALIGAHSRKNAHPGYATVYDWLPATNSWAQRGQSLEGEGKNDCFGSSVALSSDGNTALVAGLLNNSNGTQSGHIRIYDWDGKQWIQRGVDICGAARDRLGWSASLSSDGKTTLVAGKRMVSAQSIAEGWTSAVTGVARVYDWNGRKWIQRGLDINEWKLGSYFGFSNSISSDGGSIAVGAPGPKSGLVRVYDWNEKKWVQRGVDINWKQEGGKIVLGNAFGRSVDLSDDGDTLLVGCPSMKKSRLYDWDGKAWIQRGPDIDAAGGSVSLSADGTRALIGSPGGLQIGDPTPSAGVVRAYQ